MHYIPVNYRQANTKFIHQSGNRFDWQTQVDNEEKLIHNIKAPSTLKEAQKTRITSIPQAHLLLNLITLH